MTTARAASKSLCFRARSKLEVTQLEFSQMLGIHPVTVARWESLRGKCKLEPNDWQTECLKAMVHGIKSRPVYRRRVREALDQQKPLLAFYLSLTARFGDHEPLEKERPEKVRETKEHEKSG